MDLSLFKGVRTPVGLVEVNIVLVRQRICNKDGIINKSHQFSVKFNKHLLQRELGVIL